MDFKKRLDEIDHARRLTAHESDAVLNTHERLVLAREVCISVFGREVPDAVVASVLSDIAVESRFLLLNDERLLSEAAGDGKS